MQDGYDNLFDKVDNPKIDFGKRSDLKRVYFDFLADFRNYLSEYVRESLFELSIGEMAVNTIPKKMFNGEHGGMSLVVKNQGDSPCYVNTNDHGLGGFRLDPGEKEKFWLNKETYVVTQEGSTTIGFIRS